MSMLKLKLIAIPVTPYLPTNKSAKSRSRIKVMIEISVFAFMSAWSNYLLFNTLILTGKVPIMATYLRSLSMNDQMIADYGVFSAMALVYMLPVFVFFIISQK